MQHFFKPQILKQLRQSYQFTTFIETICQTTKAKELRIFKQLPLIDLLAFISICKTSQFKPMVQNALNIYQFSKKIIGETIPNFVISRTAAKMFTAGQTLEDLNSTIMDLNSKGIHLQIAYSNETAVTDTDMDKTVDEILNSLKVASRVDPGNSISVKLTGLTNFDMLVSLNKNTLAVKNIFKNIDFKNIGTITAQDFLDYLKDHNYNFSPEDFKEYLQIILQKNPDQDFKELKITALEWRIFTHAYYLDCQNKNNNQIVKQLLTMNQTDVDHLKKAAVRLRNLINSAVQYNSKITIDAEYYKIQQAINSIVEQYQLVYNVENPYVFNVIQNYLKASKERIAYEIQKCKFLKVPIALRMVRGAYLVDESQYSEQFKYENPIWPSYDATTDAIQQNSLDLLNNFTPKSQIFLASHNQNTAKFFAKQIVDRNLDKKKCGINFIQLKGLADNLTYTLLKDGYNANKYLPYGEVNILMPYLLRRAQESLQLNAIQSQFELYADELKKRILFKD